MKIETGNIDATSIEIGDISMEGRRIGVDTLMEQVSNLHHTLEDLQYGDLENRLSRFQEYVLTQLPLSEINLTEFDVNRDLAAEYSARVSDTNTYPPIVFDGVGRSIIDGIHRANAVALSGHSQVWAWVGLLENLDPEWEPWEEV